MQAGWPMSACKGLAHLRWHVVPPKVTKEPLRTKTNSEWSCSHTAPNTLRCIIWDYNRNQIERLLRNIRIGNKLIRWDKPDTESINSYQRPWERDCQRARNQALKNWCTLHARPKQAKVSREMDEAYCRQQAMTSTMTTWPFKLPSCTPTSKSEKRGSQLTFLH